MGNRRRPAPTTLAAASLITALTAGFMTYVLRSATREDDGADLDASLLGLNAQQADNATALTRMLIIAVSVISVLLLIGIVRRRPGARYAAIGVFGLLALVVFAESWSGLTADPPAPNALYGVLSAVVDALIVGLLLAPATADDFDRAEHEREWLRTRGVPLPPDRR